jgi:hypothetical protein
MFLHGVSSIDIAMSILLKNPSRLGVDRLGYGFAVGGIAQKEDA